MMSGFSTQDTIKPQIVVRIKTDNLLPDSIFRRMDEKPAYIRDADSGLRGKSFKSYSEKLIISDTTSVCARNPIADVTLSDSINFLSELKHNYPAGPVPFHFAGRREGVSPEWQTGRMTSLKDGEPLAFRPLHNDWIIAFILFASLLFLVIRKNTRSLWPELIRYVMLRGINDSSSRDIGTIFTWQHTVRNLISFIILGLFTFCAAAWYDFIPGNIPPLIFILISFGLVVFAITSRHIICKAAGSLSGEAEVFNEYLVSIYQSYRFSSVFLFILTILVVYTTFLAPGAGFTAGLIVLSFFYFHRVFRLMLIFIKKDISILYLILYLCALEILPVLILVKYFDGNV
jgi:hypothetical protein